jgi:hypothetical protein
VVIIAQNLREDNLIIVTMMLAQTAASAELVQVATISDLNIVTIESKIVRQGFAVSDF